MEIKSLKTAAYDTLFRVSKKSVPRKKIMHAWGWKTVKIQKQGDIAKKRRDLRYVYRVANPYNTLIAH